MKSKSRLRGGLTAVLAAALLAAGIASAGAATAGTPPVSTAPVPLRPVSGHAPTESALAARQAMIKGTATARQHAVPNVARSTAVNLAPTGSLFTALAPVRVLDTRTAIGGLQGAVQAGQTIVLDLSANVPASATAVVLNVTGTDVTQSTYVTVWQDGVARPTASNLNLVAGQTRPNGVTVGLGPGHKIDLYNAHGAVNLVADLAGYYTPGTGAGFTSTSPTRVLDTRNSGPVGENQAIVLDLSANVPSSATAVTFNLTGLGATTNTYVTAWPDGASRPTASSLNLSPGDVSPNLVTVALGANGKIDLYNAHGSAQLVVDLAGYYATGAGNAFYQLLPDRVLDTRYGSPLGTDEQDGMDLSAWMPAAALTASAVVFNLTGTDTTNNTYVTAWPNGASLPTASNLNLAPGQTASNLTIVGMSSDWISLYNHTGFVDLIMDLAGYFAPLYPACTARCVYAWGNNTNGQLGNGTTGGWSTTPTPMTNMTNAAKVTAGAGDGYALDNSTLIESWGYNGDGELSNGVPYGLSPTKGTATSLGLISSANSLVAGAWSGYAVQNGNAYAWGYNGDGELGVGTQSQDVPLQVPVTGTVSQVAAGYNTGYALTTDGSVWAWGANGGSLGNGTYGTGCNSVPVGAGCRSTPIKVPNLTNVVSIWADWSDTFAIKSDGTVWAWGWNAESELGIDAGGGAACYNNPLATNCDILSPVRIPGFTGATKIAGGTSTTFALMANGTVLAVGWNGQGELGDGVSGSAGCPNNQTLPNCYSASPVAVSGLTGAKDITAGELFGMALNADGTVSTWGDDTYGQLGLPASADVPTQVPGLSGITAIGAGGLTGFASADTP